MIGELAVERATDEDFQNMERVLGHIRRAATEGRAVALPAADFHLAMAAAAHNQVLLTIMRSIRNLLHAGGRSTEHLENHALLELERHERLYDALRARNAQRVREEILAHLETFMEEHRLSERFREGRA